MSDALAATIDRIGQAVEAGDAPEVNHDLLVAATLVQSVAEADTQDHPVLARADEHLRDAGANGCSEVRFHTRHARNIIWVLNGGGPVAE